MTDLQILILAIVALAFVFNVVEWWLGRGADERRRWS